MSEAQLNERQREVLAAIVREYIVTGEAVGSRTLVRRQGIEQSPATIRNVMADLEEHGLLVQPHTSAGRVPSESGLRFFIDRLMQTREISEGERREILSRYSLSNVELQELLREVSRLLSEVSEQCAIVLVPRSDASVLKHIEFIPIGERRLIAVLVMGSGLVQNRLVLVPQELDRSELERVHNYLNSLCAGKTLSEVRDRVAHALEDERSTYDQTVRHALELGASVLKRPMEDELVIDGKARLLDHPQVEREQMKALLNGIEQKRAVLTLLEETLHGEGVQVFIGAETKQQEFRNYALIASAYGASTPLGTLGVLGPTNMDYPRVISLVDFSAGILSHLLR